MLIWWLISYQLCFVLPSAPDYSGISAVELRIRVTAGVHPSTHIPTLTLGEDLLPAHGSPSVSPSAGQGRDPRGRRLLQHTPG